MSTSLFLSRTCLAAVHRSRTEGKEIAFTDVVIFVRSAIPRERQIERDTGSNISTRMVAGPWVPSCLDEDDLP